MPHRPYHHAAPVSPSQVATIRQRGLEEAHRLLQNALADSTRAKQRDAAGELASWLDNFGEGSNLTNCTPEDLLIYIVEHWLPTHRGRKREDGLCGPSALKSHLSSLSGHFTGIARDGRYDESSGRGNPCDSVWVSDFRKAYQRLSMQGGYQEESAVPLTAEKYQVLVRYLWGLIQSANTVLQAMLGLRDLLCAQYMWASTQRGHDVGKLGLEDFVDPAKPQQPFDGFPLLDPSRWPPGYFGPRLCIAERGTKTNRFERAPPIYIQPNPGEPQFCFVRTLALYTAIARRPDAPAGSEITDHLFRPLRPDRCGFKPEPLSSAALGARVRLHLMMSGAYEGETNHSFRRGALQHAAAQGAPLEALHAQSQIRTAAVLKRYLDTERHGARQVRRREESHPK